MDYFDAGLDNTAYCEVCLRTVCIYPHKQISVPYVAATYCVLCLFNPLFFFQAHCHQKRSNHVWSHISVPQDFKSLQEACSNIPRLYMELFAVVCIETSHYVAFVKCGSGLDAPWCFFDSMADRKGE